MAAAGVKLELTCSVCRDIYKDPVTLPCGHSYCRVCIRQTWDIQGETFREHPSCPECRERFPRRPELKRNLRLGNIAERFSTSPWGQDGAGISCSYCASPAAKSCLHCEASLCDQHVETHRMSEEHVLLDPTTSFSDRKCSVHKEQLKYYCTEDHVCVCPSCFAVDHKSHRVEQLSEASEKKKKKLRNVVVTLLAPKREGAKKAIHALEERRKEVEDKTSAETQQIAALFSYINGRLGALKGQFLDEISRKKEKASLSISQEMERLDLNKDELSWKISHCEMMCSMADPLTVLQERESERSTYGEMEEEATRDDVIGTVGDVDVGRIGEALRDNVTAVASCIKQWWVYGQEATDLVLDERTAANNLSLSTDMKSASHTLIDQLRPQTTGRFQVHRVLSKLMFRSGRHFWDVEVSESGEWEVGAAYPSVEREGLQSYTISDNKWWGLRRRKGKYLVRHDSTDDRAVTSLSSSPSCSRIRISLDYEVGRLSFYELSDPIRHLHTFTATFTEPLHAAFWVGGGRVRIIT
ncbi:hypothetical protein GDO86_018307 [Hymenochirus boettgeri]|uniref:Uncharacterized protein n=1 Tax=Hymenochirus boettgeri TaxID=247094 RepID=A0A8T2IJ19_9PIPI|nr:hypothetical protein GDO86_018307 [Hymenochirus boettgeri]